VRALLNPPDSASVPHEQKEEEMDAAVTAGLNESMDAFERRLIENALSRSKGNVAEAARILSTDRPNLYRRMKRLGIDS
jgi:transcriptional regulator with GAF, ATPase, and Fis domain